MSYITMYKKCPNCGHDLEKPTIREVIRETWKCWICGNKMEITGEIKSDLLEDLASRLDDVEAELAELKVKNQGE